MGEAQLHILLYIFLRRKVGGGCYVLDARGRLQALAEPCTASRGAVAVHSLPSSQCRISRKSAQ